MTLSNRLDFLSSLDDDVHLHVLWGAFHILLFVYLEAYGLWLLVQQIPLLALEG